jgi:branched-chain amino acid transport system substrate-binding protein
VLHHRRACFAGAAVCLLAVLVGTPSVANAAVKPTGPPIAVQLVNLDATSSTTAARQGVTAAVKHLNRKGGIAGRPLEITECLTDATTERGKACVDQAIATRVAAVLAVQPGPAADHVPALSAAGIPYVGQTCNTNTTLSGQYTSFCFGSDFVGLYTAAANYLKTLGTVKRALLPYVNVPAAATGVRSYGDTIMVRAGITPVDVPIPEATVDVGAVLTPALHTNPDALIGLLTGPGCISAMTLRATIAVGKPFVFPAMCTDPDVLSDAGAGAKGSLFVRQTVAFDRRNADVRTFRKAMARYARHGSTDDVYVQAGFASVMNLESVLRLVPVGTTIDAASTTAALRGAKSVPLFLTPGGTFTCDGSAYPGLRAVCSLQARVLEYQGKGRWLDRGIY